MYTDFYMSAEGQTFCVHADNARSNWPVAASFVCTCTTFSRKWTLHLLYCTNMQQQECQQSYGFSFLAMCYFSYKQVICMFFDWGIKNDHNIFIISMYQRLRKHVKIEVLTSPIIILKPVCLPLKIPLWPRILFFFFILVDLLLPISTARIARSEINQARKNTAAAAMVASKWPDQKNLSYFKKAPWPQTC